MMFFHTFHRSFVPGVHNTYRPHLIRREALVFFLVLLFAIEGFFVADLFVQEARPGLFAAVAAAPTPPQTTFINSLERQVIKVVTDPRAAVAWALYSVLAVLCTALVLTFFFHLHIQPMDLLMPGSVVAGIGVLFLFTNTLV